MVESIKTGSNDGMKANNEVFVTGKRNTAE